MVNRQIKTCRKKRHVRIDNMKEMPNLICSNAAVGGNFKSTRDITAAKKECRKWYDEYTGKEHLLV